MAHKPEIQYIHQFYVPGSEARKVAPVYTPHRSQTKLPKAAPRGQVRVQIDPIALGSMVVAVVMLVLMVVGVAQYSAACEQHEAMSAYVTQLRDENALLEHDYRSGYDIEEIEQQARAIGMIPASETTTIQVQVSVPQPEPEPTLWDDIVWFLEGLLE